MARRTNAGTGEGADSVAPVPAPDASKPTLQGVSRALRVLELFAQRPMRASDAATALTMSWATLHRTIAQLEEEQFLERDDAGIIRIGRRTWLLGSTYLVGHRLLELAIPSLRRAAEEMPTVVFQLVERSDDTALVLYSHDAVSGEIITRTTYGHHFPLHTGSKGQVLLAYAPDELIEQYLSRPLVALTPNTVTDPDELREMLARIRSQAYARTIADVQSFTGSISAPVFDRSDTVIAAVCAVAPRALFNSNESEEALLDLVRRQAQTLSLGSGWQLLPPHHP